MLRFEGEVSALRSAVASTEGERGRVSQSLAGVDERVAEAEREVAAVQDEITSLDAAEVDQLRSIIEEAGAHARVEAMIDELTSRCLGALEAAPVTGTARAVLRELAAAATQRVV